MVLESPPHTLSGDQALAALHSSWKGLSSEEARARLQRYGPNILPQAKPPGMHEVFVRQFASPLIYVLLLAAVISLLIREWSDGIFITAVLLINATVGSIQEYSAQRAASSLQRVVTTFSRVLRDGDLYEIDSRELVVGDIIVLESGDKVPADIRLLMANELRIDESQLTGESLASAKQADQLLEEETFIGERCNMAFAGSLIDRGRGQGVVVATALESEFGRIAEAVLSRRPPKAPLLIRMERFTHMVALVVAVAALLTAGISFARGMAINDIFLLAVALAVSAIPEGLPVALTVALAVGMQRMARRNVIIRRLVAVEALGSCTYIATDKTGTLTVNQLTARTIALPSGETFSISGEGTDPEGTITSTSHPPTTATLHLLERLCLAAVLPNDGYLGHRQEEWTHHGDAVDVALLVMAHKAGIIQPQAVSSCPQIAAIPFASERLFGASLNRVGDGQWVYVKGALERLLPMCSHMATPGKDCPLDPYQITTQAEHLANQGFRLLALASGKVAPMDPAEFTEAKLQGLTLHGIVGMLDPLRPEAKDAVGRCRGAGIEVAMITGDNPATAHAIARDLELAPSLESIVTGVQLHQTPTRDDFDRCAGRGRVFARVEPRQKLDIVQSLQRGGHFVAVSGDGVNDAPALRAAEIGVAMGKSGTDVARETAGLIITDDNFSSIVAGVEEGRIAYSNVRKVIFLLISTGAAEIVLFTLALITNQPLPLVAVQLLWLNLVTNGIQDVALAFEPGEGDELDQPPRSPKEPIFNRVMIERVILSALVMGIVAFLLFQYLLGCGYTIDQARNETLLLMVLFENIHVFNCRSEKRSVFRHNLLRNKILLVGTIMAQLIHIGAMYAPWFSTVLHIEPVTLKDWLQLLSLALTLLVVMEMQKVITTWWQNR